MLLKTQLLIWPLEKHCQHDEILKEEGNYKIHWLQVIRLLYEADLNFILDLKWKEVIYRSVNNNTIHPGQYGGRPGREPTTITLIEELHLDHLQLTRIPYTNLDNDCTSNFDRILMPLASLAAVFYGHIDILPSCPAKLTINTIDVTSQFKKKLIQAYTKPDIWHTTNSTDQS